jgi:hypothetical protein
MILFFFSVSKVTNALNISGANGHCNKIAHVNQASEVLLTEAYLWMIT